MSSSERTSQLVHYGTLRAGVTDACMPRFGISTFNGFEATS